MNLIQANVKNMFLVDMITNKYVSMIDLRNLLSLRKGEDAVYNFNNSMVEESRFCTDMMRKHFTKELVMAKEGDEGFENSTKCWICDNVYVGGDVKVTDCHVTGKYKGSARRDHNINVKLNHEIPVVFHNLKNYNSHLIMQELDLCNFEINVIPNGLEKCMSFNINNTLIFIDNF